MSEWCHVMSSAPVMMSSPEWRHVMSSFWCDVDLTRWWCHHIADIIRRRCDVVMTSSGQPFRFSRFDRKWPVKREKPSEPSLFFEKSSEPSQNFSEMRSFEILATFSLGACAAEYLARAHVRARASTLKQIFHQHQPSATMADDDAVSASDRAFRQPLVAVRIVRFQSEWTDLGNRATLV